MMRRAKSEAPPGAGEQGGEAVGGITGGLVGAGVGAAAGPVGAVIGGIAGAVGGWWAGEKAGQALDDWSETDAEAYRDHFATYDAHAPLIGTYDQTHAAYVVGHLAARNPDYHRRSFGEIEEEVMNGWDDEEYEIVRPYVRYGFERSQGPVARRARVDPIPRMRRLLLRHEPPRGRDFAPEEMGEGNDGVVRADRGSRTAPATDPLGPSPKRALRATSKIALA